MGRDNSMERRVITLSDFEHRLLTEALNDFRNKLICTQKPTEDINELLLKVLMRLWPASAGIWTEE